MKHFLLLLLAFLFIPKAYAQFLEDFNDGDFTNDPAWFGDTDVFVVNAALELQLMDVTGGESYLYTAVPIADSTVWDFYVRLEFAPSASNFARVYLSSDQTNLEGALNGYFVKVGGETGTVDKLELFRQDGNSTTSLIAATPGAVANDPAIARVRVTRDNAGNWALFADYSGGNTLVSEGMATDNTYPEGAYFGIRCLYTATRADKFFFDSISVSPLFMDTESPELVSIEVVSSLEVDLTFNEALDPVSTELPANYSLDGGIAISAAALDGSNPNLVHLTVNPALVSGQLYTLSVTGVADLSGNGIPVPSPESGTFTYFDIQEPTANDILINELLPDENPVIGLPEAEFIELYNNADFAVDLENFIIERVNLVSGVTKESTLPAKLFLPQGYVILCASSDMSLFEPFAASENILGLSNFSSFLPNEDNAVFHIKKADGTIIHSATYSQGLYQGVDRDGRTLELVNPAAACLGSENWKPSTHPAGGTPGQENSVIDPAFGNVPPALTGVTQLSATELLLNFDKSLEASLAEDPEQYELSGGPVILSPDAAVYDALARTVQLTFLSPFVDGTSYTIRALSGVQDCLGNAVGMPDSATFTYVETLPAERYDILINEFFADPTPSNGLPEKEYIELYNRSDKNINLKGFILADRSGMVLLPDFILLPDQYVILYESGGPGYSAYGDTLPFIDFVSLGNENDDLTLISPEGTVVHSVFYTISWYQNTTKDDGGWSLELINPNHPCEESSNWRAALDLPGGTPGTKNSVLETTPDEQFPDLLKAFPISDFEIQLTFSEALSEAEAENVQNYTLDNSQGTPLFAELEGPQFNTVLLSLDNPIQPGIIYEVTVAGLADCIGNPVGMMNTARFALPEMPEPGDLIINEVLFNPVVGGKDFVEIVNVSGKIINLNDLILTNRDFAGDISQTSPVDGDCLLFPGDYMVLTEDPLLIKNQYATTNPLGFIATGLPTYEDREGDVVLATPALIGSVIIDEFHYSSSYHYELLDDENGVSLERIRFDGETQDPANWHSAAESVGFATPAYENSQFFGNINPTASMFEIAEATFSPDNDGFQDFLLLQYNLEQPGYLASIWVYDGKGRKVHTLTQNELLAAKGTMQWDGITDDGQKARIGIYVMFIEIFDLEGNVSRFKETFVVAGRL